MGENTLYARAVVHGKVEADDCTIAPTNYSDARDTEVVENGDYVTGEVIVVEFGEVCVGAAPFATGAGERETGYLRLSWVEGDALLENNLARLGQLVGLVVHLIAIPSSSMK
jgi:hypothetical protein